MKKGIQIFLLLQLAILSNLTAQNPSPSADLILLNGKIITVDKNFSIVQAVAIYGDRIVAVGTNQEIKKLAEKNTRVIDLGGKTVVPGLIDFHSHADAASLSEMDEPIPDVHSIPELLSWIKSQTEIKSPGEWIIFPKIFFTRLKELTQPTLAQLDSVAPHHPVFLNGSYGGMINTAAMKVSHINQESNNVGLVRDKKTGQLTGFIRSSAFGLVKLPTRKPVSEKQRLQNLRAMLRQYNQYGITSICSGGGDFSLFARYQQLNKEHLLTARIFQNIIMNTSGTFTTQMLVDSLKLMHYKTGDGDSMVRIGAFKITLDGGILTGTAYMRQPWGDKARSIFGIDDPNYRGIINYSRDDLFKIVKTANDLNWKFTAHCTGGGGVDLLLDVYDEVNKIKPISERRFSIIHGNFFTKDAIKKLHDLNVCADMQPAWFYKDADAMKFILGDQVIQTFHPYKSMIEAGVTVNGGSDHMVKWDANTSVNPYNPFLAMWSMITRTTERGNVVVPSEAVSRQDALRAYTINNAYGSFEENLKGSIEVGKLADMVVLTDDILSCPVNQIKNIRAHLTLLGGQVVYSSGNLLTQLSNNRVAHPGFQFPSKGIPSTAHITTVSTFQNISIYWKPPEGATDREALVRYRIKGAKKWLQAQSLWFDDRVADSIGGNIARSKEYRGSIVTLHPGTVYEIQLFLKGANKFASTNASTWKENFPVSKTMILPEHSNKTLVINNGGNATGYVLYTAGKNNAATIDVNNEEDYDIDVRASHVIIRGLNLKGARIHGIRIAPNLSDVVIEHNDISGWGRIAEDGWGMDRDAGISSDNVDSTGLRRIIIQYNLIHHPRSNANNWKQKRRNGNPHPAGPQSVSFNYTFGQLVIRGNKVYSDSAHYFNDCIGGGENFSFVSGFPGPDSDIYGNEFSNGWDDAIESEGMNQNVRVYNNYIDQSYVAHGVSATSIGPLYVFRNITNRLQLSPADSYNSGYWFKSQGMIAYGGRVYVYHNTMLTIENEGGISDVGKVLSNTIARNNILRSVKRAVIDRTGDARTSCDYDLIDGAIITVNPAHEKHAIFGVPLFDTTAPIQHRGLLPDSPGHDAGIRIPNFNDDFKGKGPDIGAIEN